MAGETIQCATACTVTLQLEPAPPSTDNLADIGLVFSLFFGAAIAIFCAKQLLNFFLKQPHES